LDSFHCLPGLSVAVQKLHAVETSVGKGSKKSFFRQCTGNATAPKLGIVLQILGNFFIAHDVRDDGAASNLEHAEDLFEELSLGVRFDEVKDAVGNDDIHRVVGDE